MVDCGRHCSHPSTSDSADEELAWLIPLRLNGHILIRWYWIRYDAHEPILSIKIFNLQKVKRGPKPPYPIESKITNYGDAKSWRYACHKTSAPEVTIVPVPACSCGVPLPIINPCEVLFVNAPRIAGPLIDGTRFVDVG